MLDPDTNAHGIIAAVKLASNVIQVFTDIPPLWRILFV